MTAPEFNWDDFKDVDVKGKTILVLVNDPQIPSASDPSQLDPALFNGKAMTYYGRWTYKFEEGARRGAAGILIVHETGPAGYPFAVVQGNLDEKFDLDHAGQEHGTGVDRGMALARRGEEAPRPGRAGLRRAQEAGAHARLPPGAARPAGVARHPQHAAHDSVEERARQARRQRPAAARRVRRLHGALGSSRQGRARRRRRHLQRRARQRIGRGRGARDRAGLHRRRAAAEAIGALPDGRRRGTGPARRAALRRAARSIRWRRRWPTSTSTA